MKEYSKEIPVRTMGLDLGDKVSHYCVVDEAGEEVGKGRAEMTACGLEREFGGMAVTRVVMEAGTHSAWVSRWFSQRGHEVVVANPREVRLISGNRRKSDRVDPRLLGRLGRADVSLLFPIEHRGAAAQADLAMLRSRQALVEARGKLIGHVRGIVKSVGARIANCSPESFHRKAVIPAELAAGLQPLLKVIEQMSEQLREYDRQVVRQVAEHYPEAEHLQQINGVGPLTSLAFVLTLEDKQRFSKSRAVGSYVGLTPKQQDSGEQEPQLRISKAGDGMLRRLLVNSAQYMLGPFGKDSDLRRWGQKLAERGGKNAKKRAVIAMARKLAVLMHHLWVTGEVYDPLHRTRHWVGEVELAATLQSAAVQ